MNWLWHDLRFGARLFAKSPAFTVVAVLSLGLGIGANSAIFSLVNAVFFRQLGLHQPEELFAMFTTDPASPGFLPVSQPNFRDYRERNRTIAALASYVNVPLNLAHGGQPEQLFGEMVTGNYFDVMGVGATIGRTISTEHDQPPGAHPVVVLSHKLWTRRFAADPAIVGREISLNGRAFTVIGVMPGNFRGLSSLGGPQAWVPASMYREVMQQARYYESRRALLFLAVGRLKPGLSREAAQADLAGIAADLAREYPADNRNRGVRLVPALEATVNPNLRQNLVRAGVLVVTVVGLVLMIAAVNVANLLLARAESRRKEIAIRLSQGAGRGRLIRQLLTESVMLSGLGGLAGLAIAFWMRRGLVAFQPPFLANEQLELALDGRILLFTLVCAVGTGLLFGLAPALSATRSDLALDLREKSARASGARKHRLSSFLVAGEVALSMVALVGAGLFLRSLANARQTDVGFDAERLVVVEFQPGSQGYTQPQALELYRRAEERMNGMPGVRAASVASGAPLASGGFRRTVFPEGQESSPDNRGRPVLVNSVGGKYHEATGIPLLQGRGFTADDREDGQQVAVINETMARSFWPGQQALGKRFRFFNEVKQTVVVGIARDSKYFSVGEDPVACAYLPMRQYYTGAAALIVRVAGRPETMLGSIRREVQSLDPNLPLTTVATVGEMMDRSLWAARSGATILSAFAVLALVLAAIGLYGVMAYSVEDRVNEIGIRMALGADGRQVLSMILRQGLLLVGFGLAIGLLLALLLARGVEDLLYGVRPHDAVAMLAAPAVLVAVAAVACLLPGWRATRVNPLVALRQQ